MTGTGRSIFSKSPPLTPHSSLLIPHSSLLTPHGYIHANAVRHLRKPREGGIYVFAIPDLNRIAGRQRGHRKGHNHPMIALAIDTAAGQGPAFDNHPILGSLSVDAKGAQPAGHGLDPVAFLVSKFLRTLNHGYTLCASGRNKE